MGDSSGFCIKTVAIQMKSLSIQAETDENGVKEAEDVELLTFVQVILIFLNFKT